MNSRPNQIFVKKLNDRQKEVAKRARDPTDPLHSVRRIVGPPNLYELIPISQLKSCTLPWDDGEWDTGIYIEKGGRELRFNFDECEVEDVLKFLYFYFQFNGINSEKPIEYRQVTELLEKAQLKIIAGQTKDLVRKVAGSLK